MTLMEAFCLDPGTVFLNHGSFGACPRKVLEHQTQLRARIEAQPVRFFERDLPGLLSNARHVIANFVGADPNGLAFVSNASGGVNTVLRALEFRPGDELIVTDHAYPACRNSLEFIAARSGANIRTVPIPFPISSTDEVLTRIEDALTEKTRLALIDHVTSPTGLILPVEQITAQLESRGVEVLIDGAHAPGMLPLQVSALGASYYTGNFHKWVCAPKGAAFLSVREDKRRHIRPLVISNGASRAPSEEERFRWEFDWTGTRDPTAFLSVPSAIEVMGGLLGGGWPELMKRNRSLTIEARNLLCDTLEIETPCPDSMIGSLAALPLRGRPPQGGGHAPDPLHDALLEQHGIEIPVFGWAQPQLRLIRLSAQVYNTLDQYGRLAEALVQLLAQEAECDRASED
jgi:isopenicillin-N epimerase